jgi:iron complex transport system permease protein
MCSRLLRTAAHDKEVIMHTLETVRAKRRLILFFALLALCILVFLLNISLGSVNISLTDVWKVLFGGHIDSSTHSSIIMKIRLPRALAAVAGGACLAVSGLLLQIFFSNPIVEPTVLGVSSGSMMFVGFVILGGFTFGVSSISPMFMFCGALAGALIVMLVVVFAASRVKSIVTLLVIGIVTGYICSAVTSMLTTFADREKIGGFSLWTMGSFSGFTWQQVRILIIVTCLFCFFALLMSKPLNALLLGEKYAASMGVGIRRFRMAIVVIASVLTAVLTAFAGPISFVGLAVPHLIRISFNTAECFYLPRFSAEGL